MQRDTEATREARARRHTRPLGLALTKSRARNPERLDFGRYWLVNAHTNTIIVGHDWGVALDEIEEALDE